MDKKVVIIGGCGHVGLPLGVTFALAGLEVALIDINENAVRTVNSGRFPFLEKDGDQTLQHALQAGLKATTDSAACRDASVIVFVTGTPVDEHLNPKVSEVTRIFADYQQYFADDTLIIMRSTLFPGTMSHLKEKLALVNPKTKLAFCPERVAQGVGLEEIWNLPQIVSAFDDQSFNRAKELFSRIAPSIIKLSPLEAELTKLMANSWRYLEFAIANQFYAIAEQNGVDFYRLYEAIRYEYPRAKGYKSPGFAAGPCLFKDTMQLASFFDHQFHLGHTAMLVNEGLAGLAVDKAKKALGGNLWGKKVALLGMAFKANNDDIRESLSFKVKKTLEFNGATVLWHDPYLPESMDLESVLKADAVIIGTPHAHYQGLTFKQPVVDVWGMVHKAKLEVFPGAQVNR
ncbi:nucleotide sugar dehydrogenase [bacterium]|nr:nucleotide sugar dehydrogenase [bacterium]